jgi:hypothetical protein
MRRSLAVLLFYSALALVFTAPVSLSPASLAVNDGDPLHISWILAWDAHQLVRDPLHLFDSNSFYPYEESLAFSEHLVVPALLAAPFFYLTGNALLAQNLAVLLTLALSAWTMFLLVREVFGREDAALVAGTVYVFHTYNFHEVARLQLLSIQWWPLALLHLHRLFSGGGTRNAVGAAFFFLLQGLSCTYYLFYFALVLAIWIPAYAVSREGGMRRLARLVAPFAVAGLVLAVFFLPYQRVLEKFDYQRELAEGVDAVAYLRPPAGSLLSSFVSFDTDSSIVPQFLGFAAIALALLGLALPPRRDEDGIRSERLFFWLAASTAALGFVLSLGPDVRIAGSRVGPGLYGLLYDHVPFFQVLRNPERLCLLVHFGLAIASGWGASRLIARVPRRGILAALLVVLPFEHFTGGQPFVRIPTGEEVPDVYTWLRTEGWGKPLVELPLYERARLRLHSLYMFYSTVHFQPIVFGRTSFYPPLTGYLAWELRNFPDPDSLALLRHVGVERVVVRPGVWPPEERGEKLMALTAYSDELLLEGRFPPLEGDPVRRYGFGDERVFRLVARNRETPVDGLCTPSDEIDPQTFTVEGDGVTPAAWAVDRDRRTRYRSEGQLPGPKLDIIFGRPETVSALRLAVGHPYDQFPRDVTLKASLGERGPFERIAHRDDLFTKLEVVDALVDRPVEAAVTLRFPPITARRLRIWLREGKGFDYSLPDWSLPELYVYRSCKLSGPTSRHAARPVE